MIDANEIVSAIVTSQRIRNMIDDGIFSTTLEHSLNNYIDKCIVDKIEYES